MARGNKYRCRVCGRTYTYCPACEFSPDPVLEDNFCSHECKNVFDLLSLNGCGLATPTKTLAALGNLASKTFLPEIQAHINSLTSVKTEEIEEPAAVSKKKLRI